MRIGCAPENSKFAPRLSLIFASYGIQIYTIIFFGPCFPVTFFSIVDFYILCTRLPSCCRQTSPSGTGSRSRCATQCLGVASVTDTLARLHLTTRWLCLSESMIFRVWCLCVCFSFSSILFIPHGIPYYRTWQMLKRFRTFVLPALSRIQI